MSTMQFACPPYSGAGARYYHREEKGQERTAQAIHTYIQCVPTSISTVPTYWLSMTLCLAAHSSADNTLMSLNSFTFFGACSRQGQIRSGQVRSGPRGIDVCLYVCLSECLTVYRQMASTPLSILQRPLLVSAAWFSGSYPFPLKTVCIHTYIMVHRCFCCSESESAPPTHLPGRLQRGSGNGCGRLALLDGVRELFERGRGDRRQHRVHQRHVLPQDTHAGSSKTYPHPYPSPSLSAYLRGSHCAELEPVSSVREGRGPVAVLGGHLDERQRRGAQRHGLGLRHVRLTLSICRTARHGRVTACRHTRYHRWPRCDSKVRVAYS